MPTDLHNILADTLQRYLHARQNDRVGRSSPVWQILHEAPKYLAATDVVRRHPGFTIKASAGQGAWARIPWIALLHPDVTTTTRDGVYIIYLFREDMSGVYLTLNQGVTRPVERHGKEAGLAAVRERAVELRAHLKSLSTQSFSLEQPIDLRSDYVLAQRYTASTIAHKLYPTEDLPSETVLLADLDVLLGEFEQLIRSSHRQGLG